MEISESRILVAGATGELGGRFARALSSSGAKVAVAGRDTTRLAEVSTELGAPAVKLDFSLEGSAAEAVADAAEELGGLDGLVIATGAVAFGRVGEIPVEAESEVFQTNTTGPVALISAALGEIGSGGVVVAITGIVAEFPTAGMAAYSASKSALAAYLAALRRERRKEIAVIEVSPGHMETGFADRTVAGEPPAMPEAADPDELVAAVIEAIASGRREVRWDMKDRVLRTK
ncbi:MAG: SDR family NAD(P)-dependent oxidoreductase [Solirubrobacterales bacterium]